MKQDYTLDNLLLLNNEIHELSGGWWVKYEAKKIKGTSKNKPFGIKYSITLHNPQGSRVLGYDNAHAVFRNSNLPHDHKHKGKRVATYEYRNAKKLLIDFWNDVDKILILEGLL
jgi:hypothetical protein